LPIDSDTTIEMMENRSEIGFPYGFLVGFLPLIL